MTEPYCEMESFNTPWARCDRPARFLVDGKVWMCAEHYDDYEQDGDDQ